MPRPRVRCPTDGPLRQRHGMRLGGRAGRRRRHQYVAGTGSIAYGEFQGRSQEQGLGGLFSDEGSAYWLAREGLRLFSRMSDGRAPRGPLYEMVKRHFALETDLDLCALINGTDAANRSQFAQHSKLVAAAAEAGDPAAITLFAHAARELADMVDAVREQLQFPAGTRVAVSCSGGLFPPGRPSAQTARDRAAAPLDPNISSSRRCSHRMQVPRCRRHGSATRRSRTRSSGRLQRRPRIPVAPVQILLLLETDLPPLLTWSSIRSSEALFPTARNLHRMPTAIALAARKSACCAKLQRIAHPL